jgi:hypothetical protein
MCGKESHQPGFMKTIVIGLTSFGSMLEWQADARKQ